MAKYSAQHVACLYNSCSYSTKISKLITKTMYKFVIGYRSRPIQSYLSYKFYQLPINRLFVTNICALRLSKLPLSLKSDARMEYLSKFNKSHLHYNHYQENMKNNFTESNYNISPLLQMQLFFFFYFAFNQQIYLGANCNQRFSQLLLIFGGIFLG